MHPHRYGPWPGKAVPETAAGDRTVGAALVDSHARPAADLTPQKKSASAAQATQSRDQTEHTDCACAATSGRSFSTLRAELAQIGHELQPAPWGGYLIARWNRSREEASQERVAQFMRRTAP